MSTHSVFVRPTYRCMPKYGNTAMHLKLKTIKIGPKQYPDNMVVDCAFTKKIQTMFEIAHFCAYALLYI